MKTVETLVVGAGPVGLFAAAELHRRGHACLLIERAPSPSTHSKALAVMPGTMELFERGGVAQAFVRAANRIDGVRFATAKSSTYVPFASIPSRYNYVSILPQWKTEELLSGHLRECGGEVQYAHELTALEVVDEGVIASVRTPDGIETFCARYVLGCDGVHSTVREAAGISFEGDTYPGTALLADVVIDTAIPANEARVHVNARGVVTMFPMDEHIRRIVVIAPGEKLPDRADLDWLQARSRSAGYAKTEIRQVLWSNAFRVHRRVASAMRCNNVFLAGDSVHTHSPVGGQGMNIGLHDAWSLGCKIAGVLDGSTPAEALDEYERERLPVARGVVRRTDLLTRALVHPNPLLRVTRERIAPRVAALPMVYRPMLRRLSQLDGVRRLTA